jgi:O-antigen biosynthesis protein WbqP
MVSVLVKMTAKGTIVEWSYRVGKNNASFEMSKFRSMKVDTPLVATDVPADPKSLLKPVGIFYVSRGWMSCRNYGVFGTVI